MQLLRLLLLLSSDWRCSCEEGSSTPYGSAPATGSKKSRNRGGGDPQGFSYVPAVTVPDNAPTPKVWFITDYYMGDDAAKISTSRRKRFPGDGKEDKKAGRFSQIRDVITPTESTEFPPLSTKKGKRVFGVFRKNSYYGFHGFQAENRIGGKGGKATIAMNRIAGANRLRRRRRGRMWYAKTTLAGNRQQKDMENDNDVDFERGFDESSSDEMEEQEEDNRTNESSTATRRREKENISVTAENLSTSVNDSSTNLNIRATEEYSGSGITTVKGLKATTKLGWSVSSDGKMLTSEMTSISFEDSEESGAFIIESLEDTKSKDLHEDGKMATESPSTILSPTGTYSNSDSMTTESPSTILPSPTGTYSDSDSSTASTIAADNRIDREIRLLGGKDMTAMRASGNVELLHEGVWGGVCDDHFGANEGRVACRMLGFDHLVEVTQQSFFGSEHHVTDKMWLADIRCKGTESKLSDCVFRSWEAEKCHAWEVAGVRCERSQQQQTDVTPDQYHVPATKMDKLGSAVKAVRLAGFSESEGRVEVQLSDDSWSGVCGRGWGMMEGAVVCKELGLNFVKMSMQGDTHGCSESFGLSTVLCSSIEGSLSECKGIVGKECPMGTQSLAELKQQQQQHEETDGGNDGSNNQTCNQAIVTCTNAQCDVTPELIQSWGPPAIELEYLVDLACDAYEGCLAPSATDIMANESYRGAWNCTGEGGGGDSCRKDPIFARSLLRFPCYMTNVGNDSFQPYARPEDWKWHDCHRHYHSIESMAYYEVVDSSGAVLAEGRKNSFCLEDTVCDGGGEKKKFECSNIEDATLPQGISPGCSDAYTADLACQYVDLTELKTRKSEGQEFFLRIIVNPEFKIAEQRYDNNMLVCSLVFDLDELTTDAKDCKTQLPPVPGFT